MYGNTTYNDFRVYNFQVHLESDLGAATSADFFLLILISFIHITEFMDKIVLLKEGKTTLETGFPSILGLQPRGKAAMLGVKTKEYFLEEFT